MFEYTITPNIVPMLANAPATEKKQQPVPVGLLLRAAELLATIPKVTKLHLGAMHKIQTRPLFTLGFQALDIATYITKFHTTFL